MYLELFGSVVRSMKENLGLHWPAIECEGSFDLVGPEKCTQEMSKERSFQGQVVIE